MPKSLRFRNLSFVDQAPQAIRSIARHPSRPYLAVARQDFTHLILLRQNLLFEELLQIQPARHVFFSNDYLLLIKQFSMTLLPLPHSDCSKRSLTFTTQCNSARIHRQLLFTVHDDRTLQWDIQDKHLPFKSIGPGGLFESGGWVSSKSNIISRGNKVFQVKGQVSSLLALGSMILVGQVDGCLKLYDSDPDINLVQEINDHVAPILQIIENGQCIYVTGSDSRVITYILSQHKMRRQSIVRGQSHDILALCLMDQQHILSGGLSRDLCIYRLKEGVVQGVVKNEVPINYFQKSSLQGTIFLVNCSRHADLYSLHTPTACLLRICSEHPILQVSLAPTQRLIAMSTEAQTHLCFLKDNFQLLRNDRTKSLKLMVWTAQSVLYGVEQGQLVKYSFGSSVKKQELCALSMEYPCLVSHSKEDHLLLFASRLQSKIQIINLAGQVVKKLDLQFFNAILLRKCIVTSKFRQLTVQKLDGSRQKKIKIPTQKIRTFLVPSGCRNTIMCISDGGVIVVNDVCHEFSRKKHMTKAFKVWRMTEVIGECQESVLTTRIDMREYLQSRGIKAVISKAIK